jgi:hypothetical protein
MIWKEAPFGFGSDGVFGSFAFGRIPCSLPKMPTDFTGLQGALFLNTSISDQQNPLICGDNP